MSKIDGTNLKRLPVKYIRDRAKSAYTKDTKCFICGTEEALELHHFNTVDVLWEVWVRTNKIQIKSVDDILLYRDKFIEEHKVELYDKVVTLCSSHHDKLHSVYGKAPLLSTAAKQENWVNIQRSKHVAI